MVTELGDREFAELLATVWEHRGWQTEIEARGEEFVVAGDKPDGTRGLILLFPGQSVTVDAEQVQALETLRDQKGLDVPVAATQGTFSEEARELADAAGLHLVDPQVVAETAAAEGFEDLLAEYTDSSSGRLSGLLPAVSRPSLPSVGLSVPDSVGLSVPDSVGLGGRRRVLGIGVLVLVLVGVLATVGFGSGTLAAPALPDLGLGGSGFSVTAVSLSGAETAVDVQWNARPQDQVVGPNGTTFEPRNGTTFVVVQLNATNPTTETQVVRETDLAFAAGETRYGPQYLQGAVGQLPLVLAPGESGRAYVVFAVPEGTDSGTLLGLPGPEATPMSFERDRSVAFQAGR
jgi:hypothetical protein